MVSDFRTEGDTMGMVRITADKLWGAQTQRSLENFLIGPIGSMPFEVIKAYGFLKKAAAWANCDLKVLSPERRDLICKICDEIIDGKLNEHFPLVIWQTGSGTHTNMNVNEVISNRIEIVRGGTLDVNERFVHPNDHVNRSQSSNDTFPTAMHISALLTLTHRTIPAVKMLKDALLRKAEQFKETIKIGRTHWMDATPLTLGQEFSGYVAMVESGLLALERSKENLVELALGGTAVGTGLNCPPGYDVKVAKYVSQFTGLDCRTAKNKFAALSSHDALVESHGALKQLAVSLNKIGNDIRLMASGPRCGLGELLLSANEPGSSIMPGKVNPTQIEALTMVCMQIMGNDVTISLGGASGHFELNVYKPLIIANYLQSAELMGDVCRSFAEHCVTGIRVDEKRIAEHLEKSLMLVTALTPEIGYDKAAEIAKEAHRKGTTLFEEVLIQTDLDKAVVAKLLQPGRMLGK